MSDGRFNRKAKVIPFIDRIERDRRINLANLVNKAKLISLEGFDNNQWNKDLWIFNSGRLLLQTGKNPTSASISFSDFRSVSDLDSIEDWISLVKSLFVLRFHRKNQHISEQRKFITAVFNVASVVVSRGASLDQITPDMLDDACYMISCKYKESSAYCFHKYIAEFAAHCDSNGLCRALLQYRYSKMQRPNNVGGITYKRLDNPAVLDTESEKLIDPTVFRVIGDLYAGVPKNHKYRFYVLMLTFLACTGRRFSEITLLPFQKISVDEDNKSYINYFPRKASQGDSFTPKRKLYLPSEVIPIIEDVINELQESTLGVRESAEVMHSSQGPDLRFLDAISNKKKLYESDLINFGLSTALIKSKGWLRENGFAWPDKELLSKNGNARKKLIFYTNKEGLIAYCFRNFSEHILRPFYVDQFGIKYYLKDLLFIRPLGLSSGAYAHWLVTNCTQSMFTTFLRYLPSLAAEYASKTIKVDFTSHHFRHTLNTLLDEGGLSDLLQTEWFGRTNPRDTKAYQHTSREKRALMLREDIKRGTVGGILAEQIKVIPIELQDAILKARVQAVHDVGTGICIHNFSQTPCERHLQCSADCKDYVWAKEDKERLEEVKRQYALTKLARDSAEKQTKTNKPKKSSDWLIHNEKKLKTLSAQLADNGVEFFDPEEYLKGVSNDKTV